MLSIFLDLLSASFFSSDITRFIPMLVQTNEGVGVFNRIDLSVEGLRSQGTSTFIFGFLVVSLIIYAIIIYIYLPKGKSKLKTGEKYMLGAIVMSIFIAIFFGYLQLIDGYLV